MPGRYGAAPSQQAHPQQDLSIRYIVGNFRADVSRPRKWFQSTGPAHFSGINYFPSNGNVLLRVNTGQDSDQVPGSETHILSTDGGRTTDPATQKSIAGSHTSAEPVTLMSDGILRGPTFTYVTYPYLADVTKCAINYQTIDSTGTCVQTTNGCVVSGLPRLPITGDNSALGFSTHISWFSDVIQLTPTNWISGLNVQFVGDSYFSIIIVRSTDSGLTWTYVSTVNPTGPGDAEHSLTLLPNGTTIVCFSRANGGDSYLFRWVSTDAGLTWGSKAQLWAWGKAPRAALINDSTADGVLLSGIAPYSVDPYPYGLALRFTSDLTTGGTTQPTEWPYVDLIAHHNAMISDTQYKFLPGGSAPPSWRPHSSAYTSIVRLSNNNLLISYDDRALYDGDVTRTSNRVYVVAVTVSRIS